MFSLIATITLALVGVTVAVPAPLPVPDTNGTIRFVGRAGPATIYSGCSAAKTVALTFDDGPYIYQKHISDKLNEYGAKGTFFINGNNYRCVYDADIVDNLKYTFNAGHQIASHTWAHKDLTTLTWDQIHDEMWRVEQAMQKILGVTPAFMRPPYGNQNDLVRQASGVRNQAIVLWDLDSGDSVGLNKDQSEARYLERLNQNPNSILALNHETYYDSAYKVLPYALQQLGAKGYRAVTVAECLGGLNPYVTRGAPGTRDGSWTC